MADRTSGSQNNMKPLDSFIKNNTPLRRVSKLSDHGEEILSLYNKNFSVGQIKEYLFLEHQIKISTRRIYQFLKKNSNGKNFPTKTPTSAAGTEKSENQGVATSKATNAYYERMQKLANETQTEEE